MTDNASSVCFSSFTPQECPQLFLRERRPETMTEGVHHLSFPRRDCICWIAVVQARHTRTFPDWFDNMGYIQHDWK